MNKLATVEQILDIIAHPNADRLEIATVLGYRSVIVKDSFKVGDKIIFINLDTLLKPADWNKFLHDGIDPTEPIKIKTRKLRGVPSQGIIFNLNILPERNYEIGQDVAELCGVSKFEQPLDISINGEAKCRFPTNIISITDEDNLLSYPKVLNEFMGKQVCISAKMDGMSSTFIYDGQFRICSRRLELKEEPEGSNGTFSFITNKYDIKKKLINWDGNIAIQAEICGPKINGNKLGLKEPEMFIFNIKNLDNHEYFTYEELLSFCEKFQFTMVKPIKIFLFDSSHTIDELQKIADNLKYDNGQPGEGIVIRPLKNVYSGYLGKNLSVKLINRNY